MTDAQWWPAGVLIVAMRCRSAGDGQTECKKSGGEGGGAAPAAAAVQVRVRHQQLGGFLEHRRQGHPEGRAGLRHQGRGASPAQGRARRAAALSRRRDGAGLPGPGGQPGQPRFDDAAARSASRRRCRSSATTPTRPSRSATAYVGTNNTEAGRAAGAAALKALGDKRKGKVALFVGRIDMQNAIERRAGVEEVAQGDRPRDPARVPGRHRPRQGEEERRGRAGALPRPGADHRPVVVQRPVAGGRHPRVVAQGKAGDRRLRRGRGDAEGRRGRPHLRDHRPEAVRVRLSVDEAAQGHQGRQAGARQRRIRASTRSPRKT